MATGDTDDFAARISATMPRDWFADDAPMLAVLLQGLGSGFASVWNLIAYTKLQTRLATTTDDLLDLASTDFLGDRLPRRLNEPDPAFSLRIRREIIRPRNTRAAIIKVLEDLTGNTPTVTRPSNAADTGGWGPDGLPQGDLNQGVSPWTVSAEVEPFYPGCTVRKHTAPPTGDNNVGFYQVATPIGATLRGTVAVWIPSAYTGDAPEMDAIGLSVAANLALRDQWQTLTGTVGPATSSAEALVLRATGAGSSNTFYSCAWGWRRSTDPASVGSIFAYDTSGVWGDLNLPFQAFVTIERGTAPGAGMTATLGYPAGGWDALGGWDTGSSAWVDSTQAQGGVTDADIYAAVASVTPAGHINWTAIIGTPPLPQPGIVFDPTISFPIVFAR